MSDWQKIETAKREYGPDILVWTGERATLAWFSEADGWQDATVPDHMDGRITPTHWMPLPAPPK